MPFVAHGNKVNKVGQHWTALTPRSTEHFTDLGKLKLQMVVWF